MTKKQIWKKVDDTKNFIYENRKELLIAVPLTLYSVSRIMNAANSYRNHTMLNNTRKNKIYDNCLGSYWDLRKPLTNNQRLIIDGRRRGGETLSEILVSMNVLK